MGIDFDIKTFHAVCLENGPVTLDFDLEKVAKYLNNN